MTIPLPNLSTPTTSADMQVVTRSGYITITNPDGGVPVAIFNIEQKLYLDGQPIMPLPLDSPFNPGLSQTARSLTDDIMAQTYTVTDPVTQQDVTVSVAGIESLLISVFSAWYHQDLKALRISQGIFSSSSESASSESSETSE